VNGRVPPDDASAKWREYYDAIAGRAPRPLLGRALALADPAGRGGSGLLAVDLGCGDGTDALELLARDYTVLALDQEAEAIARLSARVPHAARARLATQVIRFETMDLPAADFILASFSLPFARPEAFPFVWETIAGALTPGGWFAGHFFGKHDSWATRPEMTFHTDAGVRALFKRFALEVCEEEERDGETALREPKHWHLFSVIARKR
jgi:SAM-dependent methyltransferase